VKGKQKLAKTFIFALTCGMLSFALIRQMSGFDFYFDQQRERTTKSLSLSLALVFG
jgi:hypothetical protein